MKNLIHLKNLLNEIIKEKDALLLKTSFLTMIRTGGLSHNELLGIRIKNVDIEFVGDING